MSWRDPETAKNRYHTRYQVRTYLFFGRKFSQQFPQGKDWPSTRQLVVPVRGEIPVPTVGATRGGHKETVIGTGFVAQIRHPLSKNWNDQKKKKFKKKKRCPLRTEQKRGKRVSIILVVSPQPLGPSIKLVVLIVQCYGGTILNRTYGTHKTHRFRHFCYYGGTIVNMDLWYRQKPIYSASFTNNIWSY